MSNNYPKAYKEVTEILKYLPEEDVKIIPQKIIDTLNIKKDLAHNFSIDFSKKIEEQNLLKETKAILAIFYRDYWATPEEREIILAKQRYELQKIEEEKRAKYDIDVFKKKLWTNGSKFFCIILKKFVIITI